MGLQLSKTYDPRDQLEKARRKELERFAEANEVKDIVPGMPAALMRNILRARGLTRIDIPQRVLGQNQVGSAPPPVVAESDGQTLSADDDLMRQWQTTEKPKSGSTEMRELRSECKKRGIKMKRTDKLVDLRAKIHGENIIASGQRDSKEGWPDPR